MKAQKAFRVDGQERLRFLFHAHEGSSLVPFNQWLTAKRRWVKDGTSKRKYRSGFHFFPRGADMATFAALTKQKYIILPVRVRDVAPKPGSSVGSWIAREIYIPRPEAR